MHQQTSQELVNHQVHRIFIRWEQSVPQTSADPVYEYTIGIDNEATEKWDRGLSNLDIPNIGTVSLTDFNEQLQTSAVLYRFMIGTTATLDNANYVTTAQNGNTCTSNPNEIHNESSRIR